LGDLDLGEAGGAAPIGELARKLATFERGHNAQTEFEVILGEVVDEGGEIVSAGHGRKRNPDMG
jgi:hypothetical protein